MICGECAIDTIASIFANIGFPHPPHCNVHCLVGRSLFSPSLQISFCDATMILTFNLLSFISNLKISVQIYKRVNVIKIRAYMRTSIW